jgi:hypothetical protein
LESERQEGSIKDLHVNIFIFLIQILQGNLLQRVSSNLREQDKSQVDKETSVINIIRDDGVMIQIQRR